MLPFLKKKDSGIAGLIIQNRNPDKSKESDDLSEGYNLEDCAQDIMDAIHSRDKSALASALKEAFEKLESSESDSKEDSPSPHTYESQNIKAAQE